MKLSKLLATRQSLLRQAHLAAQAHAFATTLRLADRIDAARLRGPVRLQPADPADERYWPTLTALAGSQAVLEEHFSDEDLVDLADAAVLALENEFSEFDFQLEDLAENIVAPLRAALEEAGVAIDTLPRAQPDAATGNNDGPQNGHSNAHR